MKFLFKNKPSSYKKLVKLKNKHSFKKSFYDNLIYPDKLIFLSKIYEYIVKNIIIKFFSFVLLKARNDSEKRKRLKVIDNVYNNFSSKEYNFIWLSTAFYLLISFVPVIYIVFMLNSLVQQSGILSTVMGTENINDKFAYFILGRFTPNATQYFSFPTAATSGAQDTTGAFWKIMPLFLSSLYISSSGYAKLISSNNYIYNHSKMGTYWGNKIKGLFIVLVVSVLFWFISLLDIIIEQSIINVNQRMLGTQEVSLSWFNSFIYYLLMIIFLVIIFLVLFKLTPSFKLSFKSIYKGVIISVIPTILLAALFNVITPHLKYDKFGGAVGFFFTIGFFINWFVYFMFLGITFNNAYYKKYVSTRTINKRNWLF
ncbi:YihY/virulence factor BrkB family protein [Mycoplasma sp. Pen4]|uniref:YhjD/YihY/BrkB family envelope integrity protein n=1 Tax=Mycoplasma sp. Pen4 TaxID=640330 RepID=UPI001653EEB7|nr:YhjD/YihY/BrkB family envelope integrity protein [Mycoplasma sp. Pen4]QNM93709.1 YihY/virulence factor BrkB family protein [Mycoplasma sp. Pen4]